MDKFEQFMTAIDDELEAEFNQCEMTENQLLAAEVYGYSYAHYVDRVDVNERFTDLMPNDIVTLTKDEKFKWDIKKLAKKLEVDKEQAVAYRLSFQRAKRIVHAKSAAASFAEGVKQSIEQAIRNGLKDKESIDNLVEQVCYRAADLSYLLRVESRDLSEYSSGLRDGSYDADDMDDDCDDDDDVVAEF